MARNENAATRAVEALVALAVQNVADADTAAAWGSDGPLAGTIARGELSGIKQALMAIYIAEGMGADEAKTRVEQVEAGQWISRGYAV